MEWILVLAIAGPQVSMADEVTVSRIEINNRYQIKARWPDVRETHHSLRQAVLWSDCQCRHPRCTGERVDGWLMLGREQEPRIIQEGDWHVLVHIEKDGGVKRVLARSVETTHTWDDPEVEDRKLHPTETRGICWR